MDILNFLAGLAAIVLSLELLVATILLAAVCVGIGFGMRFVVGKSSPLFDKVNGYVEKAGSYEHQGLRLVVKPFIAAHALGESIGTTVSTLVEQSRRTP